MKNSKEILTVTLLFAISLSVPCLFMLGYAIQLNVIELNGNNLLNEYKWENQLKSE